MKRFVFAIAAALLAIAAFPFIQSTQAQDEMAPHVCDSTLISLLLIAEYEYGFKSESMDLATFDKGQYAPFFDAMMMMMEAEEMMEEEMMEEEMMATEEMMMEDMTMLTPGAIEGEDEACTTLRAELDTFLYKTITDAMMMMEEES